MLHEDTKDEDFTAFVESNEVGLRGALTAALGGEVVREAAAEAFAYGRVLRPQMAALPSGGSHRLRTAAPSMVGAD